MPGTNSRAWLLRIQYNLFCTQYRRGRRMPLVWLDEGEPDPARRRSRSAARRRRRRRIPAGERPSAATG